MSATPHLPRTLARGRGRLGTEMPLKACEILGGNSSYVKVIADEHTRDPADALGYRRFNVLIETPLRAFGCETIEEPRRVEAKRCPQIDELASLLWAVVEEAGIELILAPLFGGTDGGARLEAGSAVNVAACPYASVAAGVAWVVA